MLSKIPTQSMLYLLCGVMACVVFGSCGGGPDLPPLAPVSGTVTLDGKPIPRGTVQFSPDNSKGTRGAPAVGRIDSEGRYTLKTAGEDGAIVGFHKVRIEARREPRNEMDTMPPSLVPERYMNPDTSGLTFEVKAGEENKIDLPLTLR